MAEITKSIIVNAPLTTVYNQWTQFEDFPRFMEGIISVKQLDDNRLVWKANMAGKEQIWEAVITKQIPDQEISWRSVDGPMKAGSIRFQTHGPGETEVFLHMVYDPKGIIESIGDKFGVLSGIVDNNLKQFKEFIENRGVETGAWRGTIREES